LTIAVGFSVLLWLASLDIVYDDVQLSAWTSLYAVELVVLLLNVIVNLNTAPADTVYESRLILLKKYLIHDCFYDCYTLVFIVSSLAGCPQHILWWLELGECIVLIVVLTRKFGLLRPFLYLRK